MLCISHACLFDCLSIGLSVCLSCLSVYPSVCVLICVSACLSVWLCVCLPIRLFVYLYVYLYVYLSVSMSIHLFIRIRLSVYVFLVFALLVCLEGEGGGKGGTEGEKQVEWRKIGGCTSWSWCHFFCFLFKHLCILISFCLSSSFSESLSSILHSNYPPFCLYVHIISAVICIHPLSSLSIFVNLSICLSVSH